MNTVLRFASCVVGLLFHLLASAAFAFNPPVDTVGPLTVRIEGPKVVTETEKPRPVRVVVENQQDAAVRGTLEIGVIDRWRAEPAGPVAFAVEGKGKTIREFRVTAGAGTYSAHYPIHIITRFEADGRRRVAHPILIVETKLLARPHPAPPPEWKPVSIPAVGELALWRLATHRAVIGVFGEKPQTMPVGWEGTEPRTRATLGLRPQTLAGQTREALVAHPPYHEGRVGTILVEFPLQLPPTKPLRLRFANAVTPEGHGDGVTFRVRLAPLDAPAGKQGKVVFDRHTAANTWQAAEADLSDFAGQAVRLQLESHPGPKNDTGWDSSFWAEPTLVAGMPPAPLVFPPKDEGGSRVLGTITADRPLRGHAEGTRSVPAVRSHAERGNEERRAENGNEVRLWPGRRGLLDAAVGFVQGRRRLCFHGFEVRVAGDRLDESRSPAVLLDAKEEPCVSCVQVRHRFHGSCGPFHLLGRLYVEKNVFRAKFWLENVPPPKPWQAVYIEDVSAGPWSHKVHQLYAGQGNVLRDPEAHRMSFDGHQLASSFVGFDFEVGPSLVQAVDVPPDHLDVRPAERHYSLHAPHAATWTFIPADNVFDAVRTWHDVNGLRRSAGVPKLAGRFVFDLWGGRYKQADEALERAFRYGLTDSCVVWHNWQRWGYDYRLPEIYPPNPQLGTQVELKAMIDGCKRAGVLFALHDNYIDFYPDAGGFSYEKLIAFSRDGLPVRAWNNKWRQAQSYRYRADAIEPFLRSNLRQIRAGLDPTAYFIDVWSSIGPHDYWTADGRFFDRVATRDTWAKHFAWIRDLLGNDARQISESGHDQLVGWLDGAQANHLRVGKPLGGEHSWCVWDWPCADAERIPWLDAAHHDRFIVHGAGYPGRYEGGLDPKTHGIYSDDYIATEVLTGHPAMVSQPFSRDVVRKYWLLHDLMRALAGRQIERVEFVGGDIHRQRIVWSGGGEVFVNRGQNDWNFFRDMVLPPYGISAVVPTDAGQMSVGILGEQGTVIELATSSNGLYFNPRPIAGWPGDQPPKEIEFAAVRSNGAFRVTSDRKALVFTPLPGTSKTFTIRLDLDKASGSSLRLPKLADRCRVETLAEDGKVLDRSPLHIVAGKITLECKPGVFAYRVTAE